MKADHFLKYVTGKSDFLPLELAPAKRLNIKESMDIYQVGYFARLKEVLGDHYSSCWKILGDDAFMEICNEYIIKNPSTEWNINRYGKTFPMTLESHALTEEFPFLPELAILEWNKQNLFHKKDDIGLNPEQFQQQDINEDSRFELVQSLELATSNFNLPAIYKAAKSDESEFPQNWDTPTCWVMYKNDYQVYFHEINKGAYHLLLAITNKEPLSKALMQFEANFNNLSGESADASKATEEVQRLFLWLSSNNLIKRFY